MPTVAARGGRFVNRPYGVGWRYHNRKNLPFTPVGVGAFDDPKTNTCGDVTSINQMNGFQLKAPPWGSWRRMATEGVITTNKLIRHLFAKLLPSCRHGPPRRFACKTRRSLATISSKREALSCTLCYDVGRVVEGADPYGYRKLRISVYIKPP